MAALRAAERRDPWAETAAQFSAGMRVPGVVVRLADFGAFVNLAPGVDGLVHVSQVSDRRATTFIGAGGTPTLVNGITVFRPVHMLPVQQVLPLGLLR